MKFLLVGLGGGLGAVGRYALVHLFNRASINQNIPLATFTANILGCLFIGLLAGIIQSKMPGNEFLKLFLLVGILGGFTTFSTFSYETVDLIRNSQLHLAFINVILHVMTCLLATWGGLLLSKLF